ARPAISSLSPIFSDTRLAIRSTAWTAAVALAQLADDDRGVVAAEAKAVAHGNLQAALPRLVGSVIQVAAGPWMVQVDGGRNHAVPQGENREHQLHAA